MGVSINFGTPKCMVYNKGKIRGTPIYGNQMKPPHRVQHAQLIPGLYDWVKPHCNITASVAQCRITEFVVLLLERVCKVPAFAKLLNSTNLSHDDPVDPILPPLQNLTDWNTIFQPHFWRCHVTLNLPQPSSCWPQPTQLRHYLIH